MERRSAVRAAAVATVLAAALAGCSRAGVGEAAPSASRPSSESPAPTPASSEAPPPEVVAVHWTTRRFADQVELAWSLPQGTHTVDAFRIRYVVDGRERIAGTEYFFLVLTGLHRGDQVRAFVLARGQSGDSAEVESPLWRQP